MKKINISLIIITAVLSIIKVLGELDEELVWILKDLSIILTVSLPYIIRKIFKINISEGLSFMYIIFIFMAHYLGVIEGFYNKVPGYDKLVHTLSGALTAYIAYLILKNKKINATLFNITFIIAFTFMIAGMWEMFEFICNIFFGGDAQKVIETGVDDTMWDMIVAFIGSGIFLIFITIKSKLIKEK